MSNQSMDEILQFVSFTIMENKYSKEHYALPINQVKEIRMLEAITNVPKSKPYVKGIMNLRGKIIPIIDVNNKLGYTSSDLNSEKHRILVVDVNDTLTGLLVDEVNEVIQLSSKDIDEPPTNTFEGNNYVSGIAKKENELIVLIDGAKFLEETLIENTQDLSPEINDEQKEESKLENINSDENAASADDVLPEIDELIKESENL